MVIRIPSSGPTSCATASGVQLLIPADPPVNPEMMDQTRQIFGHFVHEQIPADLMPHVPEAFAGFQAQPRPIYDDVLK